MAKRRKKRIKWGRVIIAFVCVLVLMFGAFKGMGAIVSLFQNMDIHFELPNFFGSKEYIATVVLDPGHGGWDPGCTRDDVLEKDINLTVANQVAEVLEKNNIKAVLTRSEDKALAEEKNADLAARVDVSAKSHADYFVSIHVNAYEGDDSISGYEVYTKNDDCKAMASSIIAELETLDFADSRGTYDGSLLYVLRRNPVDAVIVEMGYIYGDDFSYLNDETKLKAFSTAIGNGIVKEIQNIKNVNISNENE